MDGRSFALAGKSLKLNELIGSNSELKMSELKPHNGNPFTKEELSPGDLHQLFPDTQQLGNEPLTKLLYCKSLFTYGLFA